MEQAHKRILNAHLPELCNTVNPEHILPYLQCLSTPSQEEVKATQNNRGPFVAMSKLHDYLVRSPRAWNQLLTALRNPDLKLAHLADKLDPPRREDMIIKSPQREIKDEGNPQRNEDRKGTTIIDKTLDKAKLDKDTPWKDLNAGVRNILKQLDMSQGADNLAEALNFSVKDYGMIRTHKADDSGSVALALIEDWNNREGATLGKLLAVLREIERIDVLRELEQFTGYKLPEDSDQGDENGDRERLSERKWNHQQQPNLQTVNTPKLSPRESFNEGSLLTSEAIQSCETDTGKVATGRLSQQGPVIPQVLRSSMVPAIPEPKQPLLLDRSLSQVDTHPVLEPQVDQNVPPNCSRSQREIQQEQANAIANNDAEPGKNKTLSVSEMPPVKKRFQTVPYQANLDDPHITCIHQESQSPDVYMPVTGKDRSLGASSDLEGIPQRFGGTKSKLEKAQAQLMGSDPKLKEIQMQTRQLHQEFSGQFRASFVPMEAPTRCSADTATLYLSTEEYTSDVEIRVLEEDTLNNNSYVGSVLSYPSMTNIQSIRRVETVDTSNHDTVGVRMASATQETSLDVHREENYKVVKSDEKDVDTSKTVSQGESNICSSCEQSTHRYSSELSSIMKKADKFLPELRSDVYNDSNVTDSSLTDSLNTLESLSDNSLVGVEDDVLVPGITEDLRHSVSAETFRRGVTLDEEPLNGIEIESETQTLIEFGDLAVGNLNNLCNDTREDNTNLSQNIGHESDHVTNDHVCNHGNSGSGLMDNSLSFMTSALTAVCNETDSLPLKFIGGAAAIAMFMKLKEKRQNIQD